MNTRLILSSSAIILGVTGIFLTFLPQETLLWLHIELDQTVVYFIQIIGAMYFAFAMLNWMTRKMPTGGIYNRPVTVANFSHFLIAGASLLKGLLTGADAAAAIWTAGMVYALYAVLFGILFLRGPAVKK